VATAVPFEGRGSSRTRMRDCLPLAGVPEELARCSACVQAELVAVWVGQLDAVNQISKKGRTEGDQPFGLAAGVSGNQIEALPVPSLLGFDRWSAPRDLGATERRLDHGLLVLVSSHTSGQSSASRQNRPTSRVPSQVTSPRKPVPARKSFPAPITHSSLPPGSASTTTSVVGLLAHVNVAAAQPQRRLDGPELVLEAAACQV